MSRLGVFALEALLAAVECLMLLVLCRGLFHDASGTRKGLPLFLPPLASVLLSALLHSLPAVRALLLLLLWAFWLRWRFSARPAFCILMPLLLRLFFLVMDNGLAYLAAFWLGNRSMLLAEGSYSHYLIAYIIKIIEVFEILLLSNWVPSGMQTSDLSWQKLLRTTIFPLVSLILSFILLHIYTLTPSLAQELLLCASALLGADLFTFFLLEQLEKQQQAMQENAILQLTLKKEQESIAAWTDAYAAQRRQTHEFQHHMAVIRGMIAGHTAYEEILPYVDRISQSPCFPQLPIDTGRRVVDVLMNQKFASAKARGVTFQAQLDDLRSFPLSDEDLTVLLANLLDNAIEAAARVPEAQKRSVTVKMRVQGCDSFLYVENTTAESVKIKNNQVVPPRVGSREHGFGLQNVRAILDKSHSCYAFDYQDENKLFLFSAQFLKT